MTDAEQVGTLAALLIFTLVWAVYMTWMVYGMSATIRMLRRQQRESPDPYGRGLRPIETAPESRFDPLRPARCVFWWMVFCDLQDDDYRASHNDDLVDVFLRCLVAFVLGLVPSIGLIAALHSWSQILWSVAALPAFWVIRLWARTAFHLRAGYHSNDDAYAALRERMLR